MLSRVDRGDLLIALHSVGDAPPFAAFLRLLRRRLGAATSFIVEWSDKAGEQRWETAGHDETLNLPMTVLLALRRDRLYNADDVGLHVPARIIRTANGLGEQWLGALGGDGFTSADGALLAGLADHVAVACENRIRLAAAQRNLAAAEAALARGGIGWTLLTRDGDPVAGKTPPATRRQRATLAQTIADGACVAAAGATVATPAPSATSPAAALATFRTTGEPLDRSLVFAAAHGVPPREARLAVALAETGSLTAAARRLGITPKTARFYAKQLYQALDLSGQADLVRLVWTGPAALG